MNVGKNGFKNWISVKQNCPSQERNGNAGYGINDYSFLNRFFHKLPLVQYTKAIGSATVSGFR